jgi:hypothetical protein
MAVFVAVMLLALPTGAATIAPDVQLWRLDCALGYFGGSPRALLSRITSKAASPRQLTTHGMNSSDSSVGEPHELVVADCDNGRWCKDASGLHTMPD